MAGESQQVPSSAPDPSVLSTEALQREVKSLEDSDTRLSQEFENAIQIRRNASQRDIANLKSMMHSTRKADRRLNDAQMQVIHEKFSSEQRIQNLIEDQRKERKEDDRRALDAALAAAEKARVADTEASDRANMKTELSTAEQLKQQNSTSNQANANVVTLLNSLQTRVEKIENIKVGGRDAVTERRASNGAIIATIVGVGGLMFGMVSVTIAAIVFFRG